MQHNTQPTRYTRQQQHKGFWLNQHFASLPFIPLCNNDNGIPLGEREDAVKEEVLEKEEEAREEMQKDMKREEAKQEVTLESSVASPWAQCQDPISPGSRRRRFVDRWDAAEVVEPQREGSLA